MALLVLAESAIPAAKDAVVHGFDSITSVLKSVNK